MQDGEQPLTRAGRRVLNAASGLFYESGINPVGVASIAETAGVTKKTLYDCFGSKDALVVQYLRSRHRRWWEHLEQRLAETREPRPLALFDAYFDHPELDSSRGCAFLNAAAELAADHPALAIVREHKRAVRGRLGELVGEACPGAATGEADDLSETLFLLMEGATAQLRLGDPGHVRAARRLAAEQLGRLAATP
ncbi:TetR family transcriptional regulator [Pseudonocardia sediminis]|uniref:TetR family transcriptional regulator n=1 Tax=Pseudonocardia sediminis TaxID=1397368 RepID=A0A4V2FRA0_PSEST|nr:TetR/AcrR family transcriptional regulator [Pseudonocardia sediminis]RZT87820.1 TetR family transcriptional regulator [Pseudonocardia sediminis]